MATSASPSPAVSRSSAEPAAWDARMASPCARVFLAPCRLAVLPSALSDCGGHAAPRPAVSVAWAFGSDQPPRRPEAPPGEGTGACSPRGKCQLLRAENQPAVPSVPRRGTARARGREPGLLQAPRAAQGARKLVLNFSDAALVCSRIGPGTGRSLLPASVPPPPSPPRLPSGARGHHSGAGNAPSGAGRAARGQGRRLNSVVIADFALRTLAFGCSCDELIRQ